MDECGEKEALALKMWGQTWGLIFSCTFSRMQLPQTNGNPWYQCLKGRALRFHESSSANNELFNTKLTVSAHCSARDFVTCLSSTKPSGENSTSAKRKRKWCIQGSRRCCSAFKPWASTVAWCFGLDFVICSSEFSLLHLVAWC